MFLIVATVVAVAGPTPNVIKVADVDMASTVMCKTLPQPGSRLGGQRYCATAASWDEHARQSREFTGESAFGSNRTQRRGGFDPH